MNAHGPASLSLSPAVPMSATALLVQAKRRRQRRQVPIARLLITIGLFGLWEASTSVSIDGARPLVDPFLWSQPSRIAGRIVQWSLSGTILNNIFFTLYEAFAGFAIGVLGGVSVGFVLGRSEFWARVFSPFIQALNAVPRIVFAPLLFVIFGLGEGSKIALGALVVFFVCFWNAFQGVRDVDRIVFNNVRMLGANGRQMTQHVLLPSAMTWIVSSLHIAIGLAMSAAIVGEYLGATRGLGYVVARAEGNFDQTGVLAGLIVLSACVVVVEMVVAVVERRLWKWKPQPAGDIL